MPDYLREERSAVVAVIYLLLLALAGAVFFTLIAYLIGIFIYGIEIIGDSREVLSGANNRTLGFLKMVQIASTVGTFIVPAFVFGAIQSNSPVRYLKLNASLRPIFILLGITIMVVSGPLLEWTVSLNRAMEFPAFLSGIEEWMRNQENMLERLTIQLLSTDNFLDLTVNILMIAILPAVGEELLFRGCLQRVITKSTRNYHLGIWIAAFVFSAIHMQFFGFLPRMLLGALFGYLLVWSNSIWLPILAHFINNATSVVAAYIYERQGKSLEQIFNESSYDGNILLYLVSFVLTISLLLVLYRKSIELNTNAKGLD